METIKVKGDDAHPIYKFLKAHTQNREEPTWNFGKYLVDENGQVVNYYSPSI